MGRERERGRRHSSEILRGLLLHEITYSLLFFIVERVTNQVQLHDTIKTLEFKTCNFFPQRSYIYSNFVSNVSLAYITNRCIYCQKICLLIALPQITTKLTLMPLGLHS